MKKNPLPPRGRLEEKEKREREEKKGDDSDRGDRVESNTGKKHFPHSFFSAGWKTREDERGQSRASRRDQARSRRVLNVSRPRHGSRQKRPSSNKLPLCSSPVAQLVHNYKARPRQLSLYPKLFTPFLSCFLSALLLHFVSSPRSPPSLASSFILCSLEAPTLQEITRKQYKTRLAESTRRNILRC